MFARRGWRDVQRIAYGGGLHISKGNEIGINFFILSFTHSGSSGGGLGGGPLTISTRSSCTPMTAI